MVTGNWQPLVQFQSAILALPWAQRVHSQSGGQASNSPPVSLTSPLMNEEHLSSCVRPQDWSVQYVARTFTPQGVPLPLKSSPFPQSPLLGHISLPVLPNSMWDLSTTSVVQESSFRIQLVFSKNVPYVDVFFIFCRESEFHILLSHQP